MLKNSKELFAHSIQRLWERRSCCTGRGGGERRGCAGDARRMRGAGDSAPDLTSQAVAEMKPFPSVTVNRGTEKRYFGAPLPAWLWGPLPALAPTLVLESPPTF